MENKTEKTETEKTELTVNVTKRPKIHTDAKPDKGFKAKVLLAK